MPFMQTLFFFVWPNPSVISEAVLIQLKTQKLDVLAKKLSQNCTVPRSCSDQLLSIYVYRY